jgi:hypothetical protein
MHTHTHAHMHTRIYTYTYTCTPAYTHAQTHEHHHIHAHKHTQMKEMYENKPLHPQAPCIATRLPPPPPKPFADQLAVPTPTRNALINKLAYSYECYPLLTEVPPLSLLSRTLSLTNVSPSHPCTAEPIHALSHTLSLTDASPSHPRLADFQ